MIPDSVWTAVAGALVGLPLALLALVFNRSKDRQTVILTQQQIDAQRIETLFAQGRALDDRLVTVGDKLQTEREERLKVEAAKNVSDARADRWKEKYDYAEAERQRFFALSQAIQQQLDDCRRQNMHVPQDQLG